MSFKIGHGGRFKGSRVTSLGDRSNCTCGSCGWLIYVLWILWHWHQTHTRRVNLQLLVPHIFWSVDLQESRAQHNELLEKMEMMKAEAGTSLPGVLGECSIEQFTAGMEESGQQYVSWWAFVVSSARSLNWKSTWIAQRRWVKQLEDACCVPASCHHSFGQCVVKRPCRKRDLQLMWLKCLAPWCHKGKEGHRLVAFKPNFVGTATHCKRMSTCRLKLHA